MWSWSGCSRGSFHSVVVPAKAGTHKHWCPTNFALMFMDARLRGHDEYIVGALKQRVVGGHRRGLQERSSQGDDQDTAAEGDPVEH
jgi:hypothetical protein